MAGEFVVLIARSQGQASLTSSRRVQKQILSTTDQGDFFYFVLKNFFITGAWLTEEQGRTDSGENLKGIKEQERGEGKKR